ncbi:hypothetical protein [Caulobacter sp. HMWF009]|uniref:hypothetical protein n=1 Tax=Caulobacter sp. HMWF009 TaxID=2056846 RepID=UPI000D394EF7|nr:hypothetical protein [Caulobacter sp. HMWF009]PTS87102.1 hypothetical protein DBR21_13570 [Caulobacter sp. HMWF009]
MIPAAATLDIRQKVRRRARLALLLRESAARAFRWIAIGFGSLVIIAGAILTPLPGHIGLPMLVLGLMIVLRYSFQARKQFIRWQKRHPKLVFPIRRLMRREPEVLLVVWQQMLRTEKMILRRPHWRVLKRSRKRARGYIARRMAPKRA